MTTQTQSIPASGKLLGPALWAVQGLLALFYTYGGVTKLATPVDALAEMMPWTAVYPMLAQFTGVVDLLGGLGILLPSLTRIQPRLAVLAALGTIVLQALALSFHLMRGEAMLTPLNVVLLVLAVFVLWGRSRALPITARR